jgi:DNA polymerase
MIVGEAPGADENNDGIPFTGKSGRHLLQLLEKVWGNEENLEKIREITDDQEYFRQVRDMVEDRVFFTNAVLCMPEDNRTPSSKELKNCRERLHKTIYAVDPQIILAFGKTAASTILGKNVAIQNRKGDIFDVSITSPVTGRKVRYPMMALLHPSSLLRKGDRSLVRQKTGDTYTTMGDLRYGLSLLREYSRINGD